MEEEFRDLQNQEEEYYHYKSDVDDDCYIDKIREAVLEVRHPLDFEECERLNNELLEDYYDDLFKDFMLRKELLKKK